ncbi:ribonuclease [Planctomycetes bacterium Poly30]|uniref:Ribonuclease n=1 Tax=Saltatorellus ferox TaxID=2528018 RepID=A0A518EM68_9BACT|nr:ribonuclease [Planctomycetes bacterium Poly30]
MAFRSRIHYLGPDTFDDPRLRQIPFPQLITQLRADRCPPVWSRMEFANRGSEGTRLPERPAGYYRRFHLEARGTGGTLRLVLGRQQEVYITGDKYHTWRQIIGLPQTSVAW